MTAVRIRELRVRELRIPFRTSFRHASADRAETSAIWVEAVSVGGTTGYGESCPRSYVTGETTDSAGSFVAAHRADVLRCIGDLASMRMWMSEHAAAIDEHPAAWCAIELALLDLFGRCEGISVDELLGLPAPRGPFRFSAIVGDAPPQTCAAIVEQYRVRGFDDFKIKLSGDLQRDRAKIDIVRRIPQVRVRGDANNLWKDPHDAIAFLRLLDYPLFAIEEPVGAGRYLALAAVADAMSCRIVLDESVLREAQLAELPGPPDRWIINVRVSKMGGLLRSLDVVRRARAAGLGIIVGAQVGETSVLTRAALSVAASTGSSLVAQEGAFGTHLLQHDVCDPPVMFGAAGQLDGSAFVGAPGFGLAIADRAANPQT